MRVIGYTEDANIWAEIEGREMTVPDDPANRHRQMIAEWEAAGNTIPAFVPPPLPVPEEISDRQFFHALAKAGLITEAEALAAVKTGDMPEAINDFVNTLPEDDRFDARMLLEGATIFRRSHPLTAAFGALYGMEPSDIDDLWRDAASL
ncbi:hypothetical protein [Gellertiella hungarica]|uniref:Uncharacterized protein n=1 Tax=Gellertiella hungarica TaxID=1572859 RepID=A0A7W6J7K2_9HYPH|nr:hypothetical protein [Gellertiella hungarica]MBB4066281.1 hypothetical protein [Gellertiella hungarica]